MIKALVAVRSGSERVTNKNIRSFAGKSLLEYKIIQLKRLKMLDGIIVNSNDDTMLNLAKKMGCEAVKREQYFALPTVSMSEVYKNIAKNSNSDVIVYCNATNPLISDQTIEVAIRFYLENYPEVESVNTANLIKEFLFLNGEPLNYNPKKQPRSQDLPDIYALNFAVNVISKKDMINYSNIISPKNHLILTNELESVDIDTEYDFEVAEFLFNKKLKGGLICC
ncbi:MAG TPA: hypothetical protein DC024_08885 [Clostridiales bacterium]|jgi:CMP-N-acetylneuraminic acid synthetase|nr:hypothetical protein [Clostridiales bacterium]HCS10424.1 hypothetical protein [Clostridiales bacterium]